MDELKFYGIYQGICADVDDPENDSRIKLQIPQIMGEEITEWARPCLPVTSNSNHPDHKRHLASEVAALLQGHTTHATHSETVTSSPATVSTFGSHTHTVAISLAHDAHTNNHAGKTPDSTWNLDHEHETDSDADEKWNDDQETNQTPEHTPHRLVPRVGQKVWVMFIAGDPNYPVWMGVELDG